MRIITNVVGPSPKTNKTKAKKKQPSKKKEKKMKKKEKNTNLHIKYHSVVERDKIATSNTHTYECSLSWLGTGGSIKCAGVKLVLWVITPLHSEMVWLCKCVSPWEIIFIYDVCVIPDLPKQLSQKY